MSKLLPGADGIEVVHVGGHQTTAIAAAGSANIKTTPGRLVSVLVLSTSTTNLGIYDNASGNSSGTQIGIVPSGTAVGTVLTFNMPALLGISAVGSAGSAAVTVCWS